MTAITFHSNPEKIEAFVEDIHISVPVPTGIEFTVLDNKSLRDVCLIPETSISWEYAGETISTRKMLSLSPKAFDRLKASADYTCEEMGCV